MRVLLKLSGEALSADSKTFNGEYLANIANQIKQIIKDGNSVAVVSGGGNMVRGKEFQEMGFDRVQADHMGMLATTLNCMALSASLTKAKVKSKVMSAVKVDGVDDIDVEKANELLDKKTVVLFGGGIGNPYFTTDTACALRAIEIKADRILIGKNKTDGVYDKDPNKYPDAKMFKKLTFDEVLDRKLSVMDATAASLCREYKVNVFVFNANGKNNFVKAANNKIKGTIITA